MLCPNCKAEIADNSVYCKKCGAKVKENKEIEVKGENTSLYKEVSQNKVKKSKAKPLIITLIIILFVLGSGFGTYKYVQAKNISDLVSNADREFDKKNYDMSIELYNKALCYKDDNKIKNKLLLVNTHKKGQGLYNQGLKLMNEKKYLEAMEKFSEISKNASTIYDYSKEKIKECKDKYINNMINLAKKSTDSQEYDKANKYLDEIEKVDKNNYSVKKLKATIEQNKEKEKEEANNKKNSKITKEGAYEILKKHNYDGMEIGGMSPLKKENFNVDDQSMYGHDCYYIGGKGGNAILFVVDAVTGKLYSCSKLEPGYWELILDE
ncbi:zinc ribbon domain-containing protein [Clostridium niameyense]|uniref:zinc ribbon domain-containing protein n=1 Tax=Clostridium niameyense TaxID=1622073 RepID=UPI00067F4C0A|nr:zinc ribbon domain-containing protein [Clostridium niameyense]